MMILIMHSSLLISKPELKDLQDLYKKIEKKSSDQLNSLDKCFRNTNLEKCVREVNKSMQWMFVSNIVEHLKGQKESADFFFMKVMVLKDSVVNNWYKQVQELVMKVKEYIGEHFETGLIWNKLTLPCYSFSTLLSDLDSDHLSISLHSLPTHSPQPQSIPIQDQSPPKHQPLLKNN